MRVNLHLQMLHLCFLSVEPFLVYVDFQILNLYNHAVKGLIQRLELQQVGIRQLGFHCPIPDAVDASQQIQHRTNNHTAEII
ncbi:hypothetical protein D3C81_1537270 [compost metagenome]